CHSMGKVRVLVLTAIAVASSLVSATHAQQTNGAEQVIALKPTNHPRVPSDLAQLWFAPSKGSPAASRSLAAAVKLEVDSQFSKALPLLSQSPVQQGTLGPYAMYYQGFAELRLG